MPRLAGVVALVAFFLFGAMMSGLSAIALLAPGGALEGIWRLNPEAHRNLVAIGPWGPLLMALVCAACASSAIGLFQHSTWGHRLAIGLLAANLFGDMANAIVRGDPRTLIGVPLAALLIVYLLSPKVRQCYRSRADV